MVEWYYKNRRGDRFEIVDINPENIQFRYFKKQFYALPVDNKRIHIGHNEICRLDFIIEKIYFREFDESLFNKMFFRWGAPLMARELEEAQPRKEFKFHPYEHDFNQYNWFMKFPKLCGHRKRENDFMICTINDSTKSLSEYTSAIACEYCVVPDDFNRCHNLISHTDTKETGKKIRTRNSIFGECMLGIPIKEKDYCFRCNAREPIFLRLDSFHIESSMLVDIKEAKEIKMDEIKEMQGKRFQFLKCLYDLSAGDEHKFVNLYEVGKQLGFDKPTVVKIEYYLENEGLVEWRETSGSISITHKGVVEIEKALTKPEEPTEHFPPNINIIAIQHMEQSQIIQDSPGAKQVVSITVEQSKEILEVVKLLRNSVDKLNLSEQLKNDYNINIQTIELQMKTSQPKKGITADCLSSIKKILEGVASSVIAQQLLEKVVPLCLALS